MKVPVWAADLASAFWAAAGETEPFPRSLRGAVARAVPLTIVSLPQLGIEAVSRWLKKANVPCHIDNADRPLHAMLVTFSGVGFVFLDGTDDEDEQRFSLAHELAHYLRDYWRPRERVRRHLGDGALDIMEGARPAKIEERIVGAIAGLSLQCRLHLLERAGDSMPAGRSISVAERDADRLAFELLAPAAHVATTGFAQRPRCNWPELFQAIYGLPRWGAARYGEMLAPTERPDPLLKSLLRAIRS